jgi:hypothetical protein
MKIKGKVVQAAFLGGVLLTGAGCASRATIETQMKALCEQHKYQGARNLDVTIDKIFLKQDLIKNMVNPDEIAYRRGQLDIAVNDYVAKSDYTGARNYIWDYQFDSVPEVSNDVKTYGNQLLTQKVNATQFQKIGAHFAPESAGVLGSESIYRGAQILGEVIGREGLRQCPGRLFGRHSAVALE